MLDEKDPESDRRIADKVISNHRFNVKGGGGPAFSFSYDDTVIENDHQADANKENKGTSMFEK
jgi:hypothetical protein